MLTLTFNAALREFCERYALPPEDRWMLMQVHYRGKVPTSERDWWFVYTSIVLVMGTAAVERSY
jgi:hypothetical protein